MARHLKIRLPTQPEIKHLQRVLDETTDAQLRRRSEAILLYSLGLTATAIAYALAVHPNTIYADLHAFAQQRLRCLTPLEQGGAPAQLTPEQQATVWQLAEREPQEFGLPYGRWSLNNFREFLIKSQRLLKHISREHLRRLLKKSRFAFGACNAKWLVRIPNGARF